ncbi:hypothetical protein Gogos_001797, partial [Gossypium gossypioides]|nr:hypothetical protein [Gossypium gossypioides]
MKEPISMDAKLMSLWMTWMFQLQNHNQLETKRVPHLRRRKKKLLMQVIIFFSTSFRDAATLLAENIRTVGEQISISIASDVVIQQRSKIAIQEKALNLYPTLCEIEGLIVDELHRALSKIPDHPTQMLIFFSLP